LQCFDIDLHFYVIFIVNVTVKQNNAKTLHRLKTEVAKPSHVGRQHYLLLKATTTFYKVFYYGPSCSKEIRA